MLRSCDIPVGSCDTAALLLLVKVVGTLELVAAAIRGSLSRDVLEWPLELWGAMLELWGVSGSSRGCCVLGMVVMEWWAGTGGSCTWVLT